MIVWKGKGIYSAIVFFIAMLIGTSIFKQNPDFVFVTSLFIAAIFSWYFGSKWNHQETGSVFIEQKTNQKVFVKKEHSLFWIKMQYWGLLYSIMAIIILFQNDLVVAIIWSIIFVAVNVFFYQHDKKLKIENLNLQKIHNDPIKHVLDNLKSQSQKEDESSNIKTESNETVIKNTDESDNSKYMPKPTQKD